MTVPVACRQFGGVGGPHVAALHLHHDQLGLAALVVKSGSVDLFSESAAFLPEQNQLFSEMRGGQTRRARSETPTMANFTGSP